jgi:TolA-binding protein
MSQIGEPFVWEGTEFEDIVDELIQKTDENRERLDKLESTIEGLRYDFEACKNDTIKAVTNIYKNLNEMQ